jgi:hypothetical protein
VCCNQVLRDFLITLYIYIYVCKSGFGGLVFSMLASGTHVTGFKPGRSRRSFSDEKILSMVSFGGKVKPFAPCRRFAACQKSLNGVEKGVNSAKLPDTNLAHNSTFRDSESSRCWGRGGIWRRRWERLKGGEINGKLPLRT